MTEKAFYTVSEFAELCGVSKQAIYKQLNNKLKDFLRVENGKKYISAAALSKAVYTPAQPSGKPRREETFNQVEQPLNQPLNNPLNQVEPPETAPFWQQQLIEKDKQIENLQRQIENLQQHAAKLTDLLNNSQVLLAAENKDLIKAAQGMPEETTPERKRRFPFWSRKK